MTARRQGARRRRRGCSIAMAQLLHIIPTHCARGPRTTGRTSASTAGERDLDGFVRRIALESAALESKPIVLQLALWRPRREVTWVQQFDLRRRPSRRLFLLFFTPAVADKLGKARAQHTRTNRLSSHATVACSAMSGPPEGAFSLVPILQPMVSPLPLLIWPAGFTAGQGGSCLTLQAGSSSSRSSSRCFSSGSSSPRRAPTFARSSAKTAGRSFPLSLFSPRASWSGSV